MRKESKLAEPTSTASTPNKPDKAKLPPEYTPKGAAAIINEEELLRRVPVCRRTLADWKKKRILPFIRIGRRVLYDWESVYQALLRLQRGAEL